jgi:hypothetical protein
MTLVGEMLYAGSRPTPLSGADALLAQAEGYHPFECVGIRWFTALFLPILPLGTYSVVKRRSLSLVLPFTPWSSFLQQFGRGSVVALQPRVKRIAWRWDLVVLHYVVTWGGVYALYHLGDWLGSGVWR